MTQRTPQGERPNSVRLAVAIASHNRVDSTLNCLSALIKQSGSAELDVYLVDDGSDDGTTRAIRGSFPSVNVIPGSGQLYWGGGMRIALDTAMKGDYDFYLWLNDDTLLEEHALDVLLTTHRSVAASVGGPVIVVGTSIDPTTRQPVYGGRLLQRTAARLRFELVAPSASGSPCDTMNGNIVLVDRFASRLVGNIDSTFAHSRGDFDYGLRARSLGVHIWVAPGSLAVCARNTVKGTWRDCSLSGRTRLRLARGKKGLPVHEWRVFARRHGGRLWPITWLGPYVQVLVSRRRPSAYRSLRHG